MRTEARGKKGHKFMVLGLILVLALAIGGCSSGGDKEVVAKVNDEVITKDELYDILVEQGGQQLLDSLIQEKIVEAEAKKADIKVTDEDIEEELNKLREGYGGEAQFEQILAMQGLKIENIRKNIGINFKIKKLVGDKISVSDEEVKEFFEEHKSDFDEEEEVRASHILVKEEDDAKKIYEELENGGDFEELAKEHSADGSAEAGGDLGFFPKGKMVKEFEEVAFSQEIGKISEPVKTEHGYHIIKVVEKKEAKEADLKENEEEIRDLIFDSKVEGAYQEWYQEVYPEYTIVNKLADEK